MKNYTLNCFKKFKCKAGRCEDSCCIGWGIDIDKETLEYYKNLEGQLADYVGENIDFESSSIKMCKDGRCPFLNRDNLCDIIINLGEEHISYICANHPRFFNYFENHTEEGIGLCCEEGARLLFSENEALEEFDKTTSPLFALRDMLFEIILKKDMDFIGKIYYFLDLVCEAEELLFEEADKEIITLISDCKFERAAVKFPEISGILSVAKATEPINKSWSEKLNRVTLKKEEIGKELDKIIEKNHERYKKIFYYYTFRYLLKDIEERELISKAKLIVYLVYVNIIFDGYTYICGEEDFIKNTILISKQMEYSEENLEFIKNETLENQVFDFENLIPQACL